MPPQLPLSPGIGRADACKATHDVDYADAAAWLATPLVQHAGAYGVLSPPSEGT